VISRHLCLTFVTVTQPMAATRAPTTTAPNTPAAAPARGPGHIRGLVDLLSQRHCGKGNSEGMRTRSANCITVSPAARGEYQLRTRPRRFVKPGNFPVSQVWFRQTLQLPLAQHSVPRRNGSHLFR